MQHRSTCIVESSEEMGQAFVGTWCSESVFWPVCLEPKTKFYAKMPRTRFSFFAWRNSQACMFSVHFLKQGSKQSGNWPILHVNSLGFSFALLKKQHQGFTTRPTSAVPGPQIAGMTRKRKARENVLYQFTFPGNCPPTPPVSHRFALSEK